MQLPIKLEENGGEVAGLAAISRPLLVSTPDETLGLGSDLCPFRFHVRSRRPDAQNQFVLEKNTPVSMRDGVVLRADVMRPAEARKFPVLVYRTPYGKDAAQQYVNADCSGSFDVKIYSGGTELFELTAFIAFDDDMKEMRAVFTSVVAPDGTSLPSVINAQARKQ
jgi:X-Pro dipeptidyl-peptidase (S15 family)